MTEEHRCGDLTCPKCGLIRSASYVCPNCDKKGFVPQTNTHAEPEPKPCAVEHNGPQNALGEKTITRIEPKPMSKVKFLLKCDVCGKELVCDSPPSDWSFTSEQRIDNSSVLWLQNVRCPSCKEPKPMRSAEEWALKWSYRKSADETEWESLGCSTLVGFIRAIQQDALASSGWNEAIAAAYEAVSKCPTMAYLSVYQKAIRALKR